MNKRVYLGMSGGVDSAVSAVLLQEKGYDVTGVYMKNWSRDLPGAKCPWADDLADAKRVAVQLGIDFRVVDFQAEYKHKVVDYMLTEFQAGRTPNPDVMCNQEVKFKLFFEMAMEQGAVFIATGHYAQTKDGQLLRARDEKKDQTYFLYRISEEALERTIFPVGGMLKSEVKALAAERGLPVAAKKESMGICFVGNVGMREFLSEFLPLKPGEIRDADTDAVLGHHESAVFYTIGQRHGLYLGGGLPYYVSGKDMEKNIVYVSRDLNNADLWQTAASLVDLSFISGRAPSDGKYLVRVRHQAPLVPADVSFTGEEATVVFQSEQRALTPGQSVVIYSGEFGEVCLGGGVIEPPRSKAKKQ